MGGIYVDFSVVNQLNSPALNSNIFANRPAAGQIGRLFVSTDTFEIYRDNGTTWDLIGGPGTSTITGTGTPGTMTVFTGAQSIGDSSLLEGATSFTTTKDFQVDALYLNGMTAGNGALYYSGNRLTLANYNPGGDVMIEANGGAFAQFISGADLSTTFYGNIIRNGGLSTQFLKADGTLDSTSYQPLLTNPVTGTGTNNYLPRFTGASTIGDSGLYYTQGANFNAFNFGDLGANPIYANTQLYLFSNNESAIYLQFGSNKYAQLSNEFGNVYLGASNSGIHGYNDIFYYNGSSAADRYLAFQTESFDRLTIEQNGDIQLNKYTTDGFLRTSGANGTLSIDTNTYVTDNIYTANGTLAGARTVNLNNHNLRFEGGANVARLRLSANNNIARIFSFATADVARWAFRVDGNETGSNAGADFAIRRYDDTGALISTPFRINRQTGNVGVGNNLVQLETFNVTGSSLFNHAVLQAAGTNRKGIFSFLTTETQSGATFTNGMNYNAVGALHWNDFYANTTVPNTVTMGGSYNGAQVGFYAPNVNVTISQGSGGTLRSFSGAISQIALAATNTGGIVSHASGFQALAPIYTGPNLPTITNYYGIILNDTTEYTQLAITNRWGVYQPGATDLNYFNGNVLIGSNTDNGNKLQVTGQATISGNLGLGVTPSAWFSGVTALQFGSAGVLWSNSDRANFASNVFIDAATNAKYISNGYALRYAQENGQHIWLTAPSGTAGNAITFTQAMTLDASGNLGIGTTNTASTFLNIANTGPQNEITFRGTPYTNIFSETTNGIQFGITSTGSSAAIEFLTNSTERMRITSGGNVLIGTNTDTGYKLQVNGVISAKDNVRITPTATVSVSTSATTISNASNTYGCIAVVWGSDALGQVFTDLIFYSLSAVNVIQSQSVSGAPDGRTYTMSSGNLQLAMSAGTYTIRYQSIMAE